MIMFRVLLAVALVSGSCVVSMEKECRPMDIQDVLNAIVKSYKEGQLNDIQLVTLYLQCGGNINAKGTVSVGSSGQKISGINLLMTSVCYDRPKLMKFLINKCYARLDCINEYGDAALHIAAETGRASMVRVLLASGADKSIRNKNNKTALGEAYSSPLRHHPFYNQQKRGQNYHFPTMIKLLERSNKEVKHYNQNSYTRNNNFQLCNNQMNNTRNYSQLRIQQ